MKPFSQVSHFYLYLLSL